MVSPSESLQILAQTIDESGEMPDDVSYLLHEADTENDDAGIGLPLVEITPVESDRVHLSNTDFVDYVTDDDGNEVGRVYHAEYEMTAQIDIWTINDGKYDVDELGDKLRKALYPYSSHGPQQPFTDENGSEVGIFHFAVQSGERQDDTIQTPTLRRWQQQVEIWAFEDFKTTEDYIVDVVQSDPEIQ